MLLTYTHRNINYVCLRHRWKLEELSEEVSEELHATQIRETAIIAQIKQEEADQGTNSSESTENQE